MADSVADYRPVILPSPLRYARRKSEHELAVATFKIESSLEALRAERRAWNEKRVDYLARRLEREFAEEVRRRFPAERRGHG